MAVTGTSTTSFCLNLIPPPPLLHINKAPKPKVVGANAKQIPGLSYVISGMARFGSSKSKGGAGVLERPTFDQSQFDPTTQVLQGGDIGRSKDKRRTGSGDSYKVLLIDDIRHFEKLVAKILPQVVPSITPDDASRLFHESRENGVALVIVTVKEHAEFYAQMMMRGGLQSTIEPDSSAV